MPDDSTPSAQRDPYRRVVFDLDGTVANTIPLIIASYTHALWAVCKTRADPDEARGWIGETLRDTFRSRYPEHADALIAAYLEFNLARLDGMVEPYPGMAELLTDLRGAGVSIGIATSKRRPSADATLRAVGLESAIPVVAAMDDTDVHKPDPAPLLLALDRLGHPASAATYVGDAVVDIRAARAAGMDVVAVTWGAGRVEALAAARPTAVVDTVTELGALLLPNAENCAGPGHEQGR